MTGFGVTLLMFGLVLGLVGLIKFLALLDRVREQGLPALLSVNHSQAVMSPPIATPQADKPDRPTDRPSVCADDQRTPRWELDRTRTAIMEELLYSGWTIADFRREGIFRGDNDKIGGEVAAIRARLGLTEEGRVLKVRDEKGERVIPY